MGPVCIFLLVVSAALSVDAFVPPRPQYNRPPYSYRQGYNQYNSGAQYNNRNYGYQSKRYPNKGLSVLPPCTTGSTRLEIGVVGPDGICMPDICVYVTDKSNSINVTTNSYGLAAVNVKGCTARVSVVNTQYEAKVLDIDLESCEDGKQKVVVSLTKTCNFNIIFQYYGFNSADLPYGIDIPSAHLLNYEYTTSSGAAGFGTTVGGCFTAPTCIYVNTDDPDNERLKISVSKSSGGNTFNVLEGLIDYDEDDSGNILSYGARVTIPSAFVGIEPENILFYVYINIWLESSFKGCDNIICIEDFGDFIFMVENDLVVQIDRDAISLADFSMDLKPMGFAVDKTYVTTIKDLLVCLPLTSADVDSSITQANFRGGATFVDFNGKVTTNEITDAVSFDSTSNVFFIPFCVCKGDPMKVMKVPSESVLATTFPVNKCQFYNICPCPNNLDLSC